MADLQNLDVFGKINNTTTKEKGVIKPFGIDLGTTNSAISYGTDKSNSQIIKLTSGKETMPSVVAWDGGDNFTVGLEAYNRPVDGSVVSSVKRLMQTNGATVTFRRGDETLTMTPTEVSAKILRGLVEQTGGKYGEIKDVVVTVPAYFNQIGISNTREACKLAGLNCLQILPEPTAAALCYGLDRENTHTKYAVVYDLGGGTFDVSLVQISNRESTIALKKMYGIPVDENDNSNSKVIEPLYIEGDGHLGGDDYDRELAKVLYKNAQKVAEEKGLLFEEPEFESTLDRRYVRSVSRVKNANVTTINSAGIKMIFKDKEGNELDEIVPLNIPDFYTAFDPIYERTSRLLNEVLSNANVPVDVIVLMGGSTKNPILAEYLKRDYPGYRINSALDPDQSVALGAGIKAKNYVYGDKNVQIFDILSQNIGILSDNKMSVILKRNSQLPTSGMKFFSTSYDNQEFVDIILYQGNSSDVSECIPIGKLHIDGLEKKPAGEVLIKVQITINSESILVCSCTIDDVTRQLEVDLSSVKTEAPESKDKYLVRWQKQAAQMESPLKEEFLEILSQYPDKMDRRAVMKWIKENVK